MNPMNQPPVDPKPEKEANEPNQALLDLESKMAEYLDTVKRVQAEFENYQKRTDRERLEWQQWGLTPLVRDLLPVLDALDAGVNQPLVPAAEKAGLSRIRDQFMSVLTRHGVTALETIGKPFDPQLHECVSFVNQSGKKDHEIVTEILKGYTMNGKVIRHSQVQVNQVDETKKEVEKDH